jgi:hypothetical protein
MERNDYERARDEQTKAIAQVEHVMNSLNKAEQWSTFLNQYAQLYAQTAVTDVRRAHDEEAQALLQNFVKIAGKHEIERALRSFEEEIPVEGDTLSESEIRANKDLRKRLEHLRRAL